MALAGVHIVFVVSLQSGKVTMALQLGVCLEQINPMSLSRQERESKRVVSERVSERVDFEISIPFYLLLYHLWLPEDYIVPVVAEASIIVTIRIITL